MSAPSKADIARRLSLVLSEATGSLYIKRRVAVLQQPAPLLRQNCHQRRPSARMDRRRSDFDDNNDSKCSLLLQKTFRVVARRKPCRGCGVGRHRTI